MFYKLFLKNFWFNKILILKIYLFIVLVWNIEIEKKKF